jgi:phage-related minor tail protein
MLFLFDAGTGNQKWQAVQMSVVVLTASDPIKKTISNISTTMQASILAITSLPIEMPYEMAMHVKPLQN